MKWAKQSTAYAGCASLPVRGAWIEMVLAGILVYLPKCRSPCGERGLKLKGGTVMNKNLLSLPVRGAWIEMYLLTRVVVPLGRSPCGERGLKSNYLFLPS